MERPRVGCGQQPLAAGRPIVTLTNVGDEKTRFLSEWRWWTVGGDRAVTITLLLMGSPGDIRV